MFFKVFRLTYFAITAKGCYKNPKILKRTQRVVNRCLGSIYLCARLIDCINAPKVDFMFVFICQNNRLDTILD